jgi:DNA repair protein RadA/Sms
MVDAVLYFEGDRGHHYRILRTVKNRFGPTDEIGVFEMSDKGLREVSNPSELFLGERNAKSPGAAVFAGMEGTRPVLVEVQALVAPTSLGTPRARPSSAGIRRKAGDDPRRARGALRRAARAARRLPQCRGRVSHFRAGGGPCRGVRARFVARRTCPPRRLRLFRRESACQGAVRPVAHTAQRLKEAEKLGFFAGALLPAGSADLPKVRGRPLERDRKTCPISSARIAGSKSALKREDEDV